MEHKYPTLMEYDYQVRFEKQDGAYRLIHYNSPWDNERELEDIRIMFEGKDLKERDLSAYKIVSWEELPRGLYDVVATMKLIQNADGKSFEQLFFLKELTRTVQGVKT